MKVRKGMLMKDTKWLKKAIWINLNSAGFNDGVDWIKLDRDKLWELIDEVDDYERGFDDGWIMRSERDKEATE